MAGKGADHGSGLTEYRIWVQINKLFCERFDPSGITGNITGFTTDNSTQGGKWVELLKQIDPYTARMTLLRKATTKNEHLHVLVVGQSRCHDRLCGRKSDPP